MYRLPQICLGVNRKKRPDTLFGRNRNDPPLRRPEADSPRDGIHELSVSLQRVQYRALYFFHGAVAGVVSHGLVKERVVPTVTSMVPFRCGYLATSGQDDADASFRPQRAERLRFGLSHASQSSV